jgi:hypothetical protein
MRPRVMILVAVAAIVLGGLLVVPGAVAQLREADPAAKDPAAASSSSSSPSPSPSPSPQPPTLQAGPVKVHVTGFFSWALLGRKSGDIDGAKNITATNSTESMIKAWIVSDYLRRVAAADKQPTQERLKQASTAIRDSNDNSAQSLWVAGGGSAVRSRMIKICGLTDTHADPNRASWWSFTRISARDAVRMGECVADGRAAGPKWTKWVLTEMTKVRGGVKDQQVKTGGGRWGIIDGLPKEILRQGVSIKNGWTLIYADGNWHVNCLAITDDWVLAVLMRYPGSKGLQYGANVCKSVAQQLVVHPSGS